MDVCCGGGCLALRNATTIIHITSSVFMTNTTIYTCSKSPGWQQLDIGGSRAASLKKRKKKTLTDCLFVSHALREWFLPKEDRRAVS